MNIRDKIHKHHFLTDPDNLAYTARLEEKGICSNIDVFKIVDKMYTGILLETEEAAMRPCRTYVYNRNQTGFWNAQLPPEPLYWRAQMRAIALPRLKIKPFNPIW